MKKILTLLFLCMVSAIGHSQTAFGQKTIHKCAYDTYMESLDKKDPSTLSKINQFEESLKAFKSKDIQKSGPNGGITIIPIVVTIVHGGTAQPENITDNQVLSQINAINVYLEDYGFRFCLAQRDNNSTALTGTNPGIQRIQNTALTNLDATSELPSLNQLTPLFPPQKYLNIYIVKSITDPAQAGTVAGIASMPGLNTFDGIAVIYDAFGNSADPLCTSCNLHPLSNQGKTLVHEFGHYLGLLHTFNGSCSELTSGDCQNFGDKVCDTPPVSAQTSGCPANANTCDEGANDLPDAIDNYMDYSDQACVNNFTQGQYERMWAALNSSRDILISKENLLQTGIICVPQTLLASYNAYPTYSPCGGTPITFYCDGLAGATYYWDFGDGETSTLEDPSHTYGYSPTPYTVTLTVTRNGESASTSKYIFTTNCQPINNADSTWFFNPTNILSFSSGTPIAVAPLNNTLDFSEPSAVQATDTGQLQFFTNGIKVWDSNQNIINSGNLLLGHSSAKRGTLILPNPANANQYYIFTKPAAETITEGFRYTIVTMVSGSPVLSNINTPVNFPAGYVTTADGAIRGGEGVTAIKSCNGYWILSMQQKTTGTFLAVYSLTTAGLSFVSEIQAINQGQGAAFTTPDGNHIVIAGNTITNLYNFDKYTGIASSPYQLNVIASQACFSPDSKVLYTYSVNGALGLHQFDITAANINASRKLINVGYNFNDLQLGPDNKIYLIRNLQTWASVIHSPNTLATPENPNACLLTVNGPKLNVYAYSAFPNVIVAKQNTVFDNTISHKPISCLNYQFNANVCSGTFSWTFGDPSSGTNNTSAIANPTHTFSGPGTYTVTLTAGSTVITKQITVGGEEPVIYGSVCADNANKSNHFAQIHAGETIQWSIAEGSGTLATPSSAASATVVWSSLPGTIRLTVTDAAGCVNYIDQQVIDCGDGGGSGTPCTPNLTFSSPESSTLQTYNVSDYIITQNNYTVGSTADITLKAQTYILIKPDSHIKPGALFLAKIQICTASRPAMKSGEDGKQLIAYPNPTDGMLYLQGIKFNEVYLFDVLGKSVFYSQYDSIDNTAINMGSLTQGIYFLKVVGTEGNIETLKIIKE